MWRAHDIVCLSPVIASGSILRMPVKDYLRIILLVTTQTPENHAGVPSGVEVALLLGRIFRISVVECFSDFAQMFTQNDNALEGQSKYGMFFVVHGASNFVLFWLRQSSAAIPSELAVCDMLSCVDICFGPMVASCSKYLRVLLHERFINPDRLIILHIAIVPLALHFGKRAPRIPRRWLALSSMLLASSPLWQVMVHCNIALS